MKKINIFKFFWDSIKDIFSSLYRVWFMKEWTILKRIIVFFLILCFWWIAIPIQTIYLYKLEKKRYTEFREIVKHE